MGLNQERPTPLEMMIRVLEVRDPLAQHARVAAFKERRTD